MEQNTQENRWTDLILTCKDCGCVFFVRAAEVQWLFEKKLNIYKRCQMCRERRREQAAQQTTATGKDGGNNG